MLFKRPQNYPKSLPYNLETLEFINLNHLTPLEVSEITERIIEPRDIDSILEETALTTAEITTNISIDEILGYEYPRKRDIFESISEFFDSTKDGYHSRSISMLKYTPDNIMSGLSRSFIIEPIKVREVEKGKCFISGNGMHRFTVLRIMYLIEKHRGRNPDELKKKYTIPVIFNKVDKTKTYCAYIVSVLNSNIYIKSELDDNYQKTEKVEVIDKVNKTKRILADEELIIYTTEVIKDCNMDLQKLLALSKHVEINSSFYEFLNKNFKDLLIELEQFIEYKKTHSNPGELLEYQITPDKKDGISWNL